VGIFCCEEYPGAVPLLCPEFDMAFQGIFESTVSFFHQFIMGKLCPL